MPTLCKMLDVCKAEHLNTQESWQKEIAGLCNLVVVTIKRCKAETVKSKSNHDSSFKVVLGVWRQQTKDALK